MRNKRTVLLVLLLVAMLLSACAPASVNSDEHPRTIFVNGTGRVTLTPDIAHISIGVVTEDKDAGSAVTANTTQSQAVMDALKGFGVADEDIRTTNFSIYPQQDWSQDVPVIVSYRVQNSVLVTVRDLDQIGGILDAVVRAGANAINGIQFDVEDREAAYTLALEAAVQNARSRAETLAEAAGVDLGEVRSIDTFVYGGGFMFFIY